MVTRGDIWLAALDPTLGSEIQKTRPCMVISPPEMNDHLRTAIVAPMTTGSRPAGFRVGITFQGKTGLLLLDQVYDRQYGLLLQPEHTRSFLESLIDTLAAMSSLRYVQTILSKDHCRLQT